MPDVKILNPWDSQGNRISDADGVFQCVRSGKYSGYPQGYILQDNVRCLNPWDGQTIHTYDTNGAWHTLYANSEKSGQMRDSVVYAIDQQGGKGNAGCAVDVMPSILSDSHGTPHGVAYAVQMFENHAHDSRYTGPLEVSQTVSQLFGTGGNNTPLIVEVIK